MHGQKPTINTRKHSTRQSRPYACRYMCTNVTNASIAVEACAEYGENWSLRGSNTKHERLRVRGTEVG